MRFELELRPAAGGGIDGYARITAAGGARQAYFADAPPESVGGALEALSQQARPLLSPEDRQVLARLDLEPEPDERG